MIIVTSESVANVRVRRTFGLVRGTSVRGRHIGRDLIAHLRKAVGGEITEYTKMLSEAREQALDRMVEEARAFGANAIVSVRFTTSTSMAGSAEIVVYGTAVRLELDDDDPQTA